MNNARMSRLFDLMQSEGLEAVAINPGPTLVYLTGLGFHLMERPTVLLAVLPDRVGLILPKLEMQKLAGSSLQSFAFGDNPAEWQSVFHQACQEMGLDGKKIGVEPNRLRFLELEFLQKAAPQARFVSAAGVFDALRIQKDAGEVAKIRQAVKIAQTGLLAAVSTAKIGMTERELASELVIQMLRAGADSEMPFAPIVGSGPNSANPHYAPGDRKLTPGDLVVIDWGAHYQGYVSDLTRTFAVGEVDAELRKIARIVLEANAAGQAAGRPGVAAGVVDQAARAVIDLAGYGAYFRHRVGHGIGMEGHEGPYMFGENPLRLAVGMTYTVEPGIYLADRGGVRIEDNMVVTGEGSESLSDLPRELLSIG